MPRVVVTDKLRSHGAAHHEVIPSMEHRQSKHLNNRGESSRQPTRQRERAKKGFRFAIREQTTGVAGRPTAA